MGKGPLIHYGGGAMLYTGGSLYNPDGTLMSPGGLKHGEAWDDDYSAQGLLGTAGWSAFNSGAGAAQAKISSEAGHVGIVQASTGTTTTGRSGQIRDTACVLLGNGIVAVQSIIRATQLSTVTEEFRIRVGLGDATGDVEETDGVYFLYDRANYGDYWNVITSTNSVRTITTLNGAGGNPTVAVAAATWYRLRAVINAAGTNVDFYIDSSAGTDTLKKSVTTNIPTGAGRLCGQVWGIFKSAGTTAVTMDLDAYGFSWAASTLR